MKTIAAALALTGIMLLAGCFLRSLPGDGNITSVSRPIEDFDTLDATGGFEIQWAPGPASLAITTDSNLLSHIQTETANGWLRISTDQSLSPTKGIKIVLSSRAIKDVDLTGAVHLVANQLSVPDLTITSTGAVSIDADGSVSNMTASLTGASELTASKLSAKSATVELTGAANADVAVSDHLKATLTGAGSLTYSGNPSVESSVTGVGRINHGQ
ncbi:MAG: head GIN domain-containing protein [Limisphaerales bacterium]